METPEELMKSIQKTNKYAPKLIPRFLKYIGKINEIKDYEDWRKEIFVSLINFIIDYIIILPFLFFICLSAIVHPNINNFFLAEGISISWYLLINLKKDLWRK